MLNSNVIFSVPKSAPKKVHTLYRAVEGLAIDFLVFSEAPCLFYNYRLSLRVHLAMQEASK